ncbi:MAG: histidine kinase dimerization/phospho-acceptor domain-containing protein, partial [Pseudomonadota bacterium]
HTGTSRETCVHSLGRARNTASDSRQVLTARSFTTVETYDLKRILAVTGLVSVGAGLSQVVTAPSANIAFLALSFVGLALAFAASFMTEQLNGRDTRRNTRSNPSTAPVTARVSPAPPRGATEASSPPTSARHLAERVSHDLRTPLNAVIGFSELIKSELHGPHADARYREYATHIAQSGELLRAKAEEAIAITEFAADGEIHEPYRSIDAHELLSACAEDAGPGLIATRPTRQPQALVAVRLAAFQHALGRLMLGLTEVETEAAGWSASIATDVTNARLAIIIERNGASVQPCHGGQTDFPRTTETLNTCFAKCLFQAQGVDLAVEVTACGSQRAVLSMPCWYQAQLPLDV